MKTKLFVDVLFSVILFMIPIFFTGSVNGWPDYWETPLLVSCYCSRIICSILSVLLLYRGVSNYLDKN